MVKHHIHIIKMGGTIEFRDPAYQKINNLMRLDATVDNYLKNLVKPHFRYEIETVCNKDSREIVAADLKRLARAIRASRHENILITHGTFTMTATAKFLEKQLLKDASGKKIIITGSMIPVIGFPISDAPFNLGFSIAAFRAVAPGVYISINGGIFKSREVEKNVNLLRFE